MTIVFGLPERSLVFGRADLIEQINLSPHVATSHMTFRE